MHINVLWTGHEYYSLENCLVDIQPTGATIASAIVGKYGDIIYNVEYRIQTNRLWETQLLEIHSRHNGMTQDVVLRKDEEENWRLDDKIVDSFKGCTDVDIPLTPFTNTLPIRRLALAKNESRQIQVIYCDLLSGKILPVTQQYTCLAKNRYHYENVPNDFEADMEVDDDGLVVDYPGLFVRTLRKDLEPGSSS